MKKQLFLLCAIALVAGKLSACPLDFTNNSSFTFIFSKDTEMTPDDSYQDNYGKTVPVPMTLNANSDITYPSHSTHPFFIFRQEAGQEPVLYATFLQHECFNDSLPEYGDLKRLTIDAQGKIIAHPDAASNFKITYHQ